MMIYEIRQGEYDREVLARCLAALLDACVAEPWETNPEAEEFAMIGIERLAASLGFSFIQQIGKEAILVGDLRN